MISWISKLCALCAMSALAQIMLPGDGEKEGMRMICGLLMLKLTCQSAKQLMEQLTVGGGLMELLACLLG